MVVKWTAEHDAYLLTKILELHKISVNSSAIAEIWDFGGDKPTPKAIQEHIGKLKKVAASAASARNGNSTGDIKTDITASPKTPRKRGAKAAGNTDSANNTPKRKRGAGKAAGTTIKFEPTSGMAIAMSDDPNMLGGELDGGLVTSNDIQIKEEYQPSPAYDNPEQEREHMIELAKTMQSADATVTGEDSDEYDDDGITRFHSAVRAGHFYNPYSTDGANDERDESANEMW